MSAQSTTRPQPEVEQPLTPEQVYDFCKFVADPANNFPPVFQMAAQNALDDFPAFMARDYSDIELVSLEEVAQIEAEYQASLKENR